MENGIPGSELPLVNSIAATDDVICLVDEGNGKRTRRAPRSLFGGAQGPTGPAGAAGAQGPAGPAGPAGAPGTDASVALASEGFALDTFDDYDTGAISSGSGGIGWGGDAVITQGSIVESTMRGGLTQKRLQLATAGAGGSYSRKLGWGSDWQRISIAILMRINGPQSDLNPTEWAMGFTAGANSTLVTPGGPNNMIGFLEEANNYTWQNIADIDYYFGTFGHRHSTWTSGTKTDRGSGSGTDGRRFAQTEAGLSIVTFDLSRLPAHAPSSSVTYSAAVNSTFTGRVEYSAPKFLLTRFGVSGELSLGNFLGTEIGGAPNSASYAYVTHEATGVLDSLHIFWNTAGASLQLAGVAVKKVN